MPRSEDKTKVGVGANPGNTKAIHSAISIREIHGDAKHLLVTWFVATMMPKKHSLGLSGQIILKDDDKNPFPPKPPIVSNNVTKRPSFPLVLL